MWGWVQQKSRLTMGISIWKKRYLVITTTSISTHKSEVSYTTANIKIIRFISFEADWLFPRKVLFHPYIRTMSSQMNTDGSNWRESNMIIKNDHSWSFPIIQGIRSSSLGVWLMKNSTNGWRSFKSNSIWQLSYGLVILKILNQVHVSQH